MPSFIITYIKQEPMTSDQNNFEMKKEFSIPPVVFRPTGGAVPFTAPNNLQQRRLPTAPPFQPTGPPTSSIPFVSFDIAGATTSSSGPLYGGANTTSSTDTDFSDEPSLLEELEIDPSLIYNKTLSILNPFRPNSTAHDSPDLSGPFLYYLIFSLLQILSGKVQFGVILGYFIIYSSLLYIIFNMLEGKQGSLDLYRCFSVVGYGLLPVVLYSALSLFVPPGGPVSFGLAAVLVLWSTRICARLLFERASSGYGQLGLIAYPCFIVYTLFSMLVMF